MRHLFLFIVSLITPLLISGATPIASPAAHVALQPAPPRTALSGKLYDPPRPAFDFALPASTGQTVRLRDQQGQVVLLFFGYTFCPDVCPTVLADIKQALAQLGPQAQAVTVLFVSVDPARDTPARLAEYLGYFHEAGYIGLSGGEAETAAIAYAYGAKFYREENTTATGGYSMAHTTRLFLINRQGEWVMSLPWGITADQLATNLRYWLAE